MEDGGLKNNIKKKEDKYASAAHLPPKKNEE